MISKELKESLKEILNFIPVKEQQKEIYESDIDNNKVLYDYIANATKNRKNFFSILTTDNDLKNPLFLASESHIDLAYITVAKKIVVKLESIKHLI